MTFTTYTRFRIMFTENKKKLSKKAGHSTMFRVEMERLTTLPQRQQQLIKA